MAVHVLGNSRHISRKEEAVDAIAKMCKAVPAIDGVEFTYTPREDLPGLPRINVGAIIGGRGRDYDMRGPQFRLRLLHRAGGRPFPAGHDLGFGPRQTLNAPLTPSRWMTRISSTRLKCRRTRNTGCSP